MIKAAKIKADAVKAKNLNMFLLLTGFLY